MFKVPMFKEDHIFEAIAGSLGESDSRIASFGYPAPLVSSTPDVWFVVFGREKDTADTISRVKSGKELMINGIECVCSHASKPPNHVEFTRKYSDAVTYKPQRSSSNKTYFLTFSITCLPVVCNGSELSSTASDSI
jgi:hypothetical protein